jgi:hypothetical protein
VPQPRIVVANGGRRKDTESPNSATPLSSRHTAFPPRPVRTIRARSAAASQRLHATYHRLHCPHSFSHGILHPVQPRHAPPGSATACSTRLGAGRLRFKFRSRPGPGGLPLLSGASGRAGVSGCRRHPTASSRPGRGRAASESATSESASSESASSRSNNNTMALKNPSTKAGSLRRAPTAESASLRSVAGSATDPSAAQIPGGLASAGPPPIRRLRPAGSPCAARAARRGADPRRTGSGRPAAGPQAPPLRRARDRRADGRSSDCSAVTRTVGCAAQR